MNHCSSAQLQSYVDRRLPEDEEKLVRDHLHVCTLCTRTYEAVAHMDASLRKVPRESLGSAFTQAVMAKIHLAPKSPLVFRFLENFAYVFGLLLVLGTMVAVFVLTGVMDTEQVSQTQGVVSGAWSRMGGAASSIIETFTTWLHQFFPFAYAKGGLGVTVFGILIVVILAAVDWLVRRKYAHRF